MGRSSSSHALMDIVLVHPQIPHNTGCAARLAAALQLPLHLVEPLGFSLEDRYLKRAGLDYWPKVALHVHADIEAAFEALAVGSERPLEERLKLFSARGGASLFDTDFAADDVLLFGSETAGLPSVLLEAHADQRVYIPVDPGVRSLNLANVVCLGAYTAMDRSGSVLPVNDGAHVPTPEGGSITPIDRIQS
jgi:tRNA (cytidine/uridine-2'-O-)-methyltransferase